MMSSKKKFRFFFPFVVIMLALMPILVMLLWNALLPEIIGVKTINYFQALGIFVLCRILFGGFKFGKPSFNNNHFSPPGFKEKLMNMSDEERAAFKARWRERRNRRSN